MDLQARKLDFIKEFLKVNSEETLSKLEALLKEKELELENPYSKNELMERVNRSEMDFKAGRFKSTDEILKKFQ